MGQFFLAENESHIYPNMCAKFGCGPTVVSKGGGGTDRQTDRQREPAASYNRWTSNCHNIMQHVCALHVESGIMFTP